MATDSSEMKELLSLISEGEQLVASARTVGMRRFVGNTNFTDWQTRVLVFLDEHAKVHKTARYIDQFQSNTRKNTATDVERGVGVLKAVQRTLNTS